MATPGHFKDGCCLEVIPRWDGLSCDFPTDYEKKSGLSVSGDVQAASPNIPFIWDFFPFAFVKAVLSTLCCLSRIKRPAADTDCSSLHLSGCRHLAHFLLLLPTVAAVIQTVPNLDMPFTHTTLPSQFHGATCCPAHFAFCLTSQQKLLKATVPKDINGRLTVNFRETRSFVKES